MLRKRKYTDTVINIVTPGAKALSKKPASVASFFKSKKPRFLLPAAGVAAGVSAAAEGVRRIYRSIQTQTDPEIVRRTKTKTQKDFPEHPRMSGFGVYSRRFKRFKKTPNVYNGVIHKREDGYNVADDDGTAVPGAHSSPIGAVWTGISAIVGREFQYHILLCILRKLSASKGYEFNSGDDFIADSIGGIAHPWVGDFHYNYRSSNNNNQVQREFEINGNWKWIDLAIAWYDDLNANFVSFQDVHFEKCFIFGRTDDVPNQKVAPPMMSLHMVGMKIKFNTSNTLFIQNRTRDTDGGDSTDAVDTNPLMGRAYIIHNSYVRGNLNGSSPGVAWGAPNNLSGRFSIEPQKWTDVDQQQLFSRMVPRSAFADCKETANLTLQPGEIKKATVSLNKTMLFDDLFHRAFLPVLINSGYSPFRFGKSMVFCFQKVVRSAAVDSATAYDSRVQIACTIRQYMTAECLPKRKQAFIPRNMQPEVA